MNRLSKWLFFYSLFCLVFAYGFVSHRNRVFPYGPLKKAEEGFNYLRDRMKGVDENWWAHPKTDAAEALATYDRDRAHPGLSLIAGVVENERFAVRVIDMEGDLVHEWPIDWFEIWPDATHLPPGKIPQPPSQLQTEVHGALLTTSGDLIFNFEGLGLVRLDVCGRVVWKLPYQTHHSIYEDENGELWVSGLRVHQEPLSDLPNYLPPVNEYTVLRVSQEGEILTEISILDVLRKNDLLGLLHMASLGNLSPESLVTHCT